MARKGKRSPRSLPEQRGGEAAVRVVACPESRPRVLSTVQPRHTFRPLAQVGPQLFFGEEVVGPAGNAQDAYVFVARVCVGVRGELGPMWVYYPAGQDVRLVSHLPQRPGDLPHVDELTAEV